MKIKLFILPFLLAQLLLAKTVDTKNMKAIDYTKHYDTSTGMVSSTEDRVISSTAEASAQITIMVTLQGTSEMTSREHTGTAVSISFLDKNRLEIIEDIAKGRGEYIETLLSLMKLKKNENNLKNIQLHLNELIYLSHNDFLEKLKTLV